MSAVAKDDAKTTDLLRAERAQRIGDAMQLKKYFALSMAPHEQVDSKIGPALSNYHLWWKKALAALDPNDVIPDRGISRLTP